MLEVITAGNSPAAAGIEARSNLSMSLGELGAVFAALCALTLLVVAWPVWMGLWPILLAALVQLLVVGWSLRLAWRGHWARERLLLEGNDLVVEQFRLRHHSRTQWPLAWTRVLTEAGRCGELRVFVTRAGRRQEVGAFLPESERGDLARALNDMLSRGAVQNESPITRIS